MMKRGMRLYPREDAGPIRLVKKSPEGPRTVSNIALNILPDAQKMPPQEPKDFGQVFSNHMFWQSYEDGRGWHDSQVKPLTTLNLHPAAAVLHYGQEIFEGLKAYRRPDGGINLFRPDENAKRFNRSAERMCMPTVPVEDHVEALRALVKVDEDWVPASSGASLYLRPTMIATSARLGLGAASAYAHFIIASPVGAYFKTGADTVSVFVSEVHRRAVKGGIGEAKTGGNYAASLYVEEQARKHGYSQVLWLDAVEGRTVEEVGAMNICFITKDGVLKTPALSGSILPGITRKSIIELAPRFGLTVEEGRLDINEIIADIDSGNITEAFGCGTAAVVSPIGVLGVKGRDVEINDRKAGPIAAKIKAEIVAIQYGEKDGPDGWIVEV